jgi:hypothetical protein
MFKVESQGVYWWNGVAGAGVRGQFSGFPLAHTQPNDKQHVFEVHVGGQA